MPEAVGLGHHVKSCSLPFRGFGIGVPSKFVKLPDLLAALGVVMAAASMGCGRVERVYTWTRDEPAMGRTSPTTYEVRLLVDRPKKIVRWVEDVSDYQGHIGRNIQTWTGCEIFDESNWQCGYASVPQVRVEMQDGELRQAYWGEDRVFRSRYSLRTSHLLR